MASLDGAQAARPGESLFEHRRRVQAERDAPLAERMRPARSKSSWAKSRRSGATGCCSGRSLREGCRRSSSGGRPAPERQPWPGSPRRPPRPAFEPVSAVTSGVADLRRIVAEARERQGMHQQSTILFVDEIHRFNKAQQDVILPHVENGTITFIGATTENPSFEVIAPLLSRSRVFALQSLTPVEVETIVHGAVNDRERGLGEMNVIIDQDALEHLVNISNGDARVALNALETAAYATAPEADGGRRIDLDTIADALQRRSPIYDKAGEGHYDTISAFIKSVRGSSPDGALYWLARMIESGEDPLFIVRRLVVLAAEDIGLAEPQALPVAMAAQQAVHFLGMPEGRIPLAEATVYLAACPKSNSAYIALEKALDDVRRMPNDPVPLHLRNAVTGLMRQMGYGKDYRYSHDYEGHFVDQDFLPPTLKNRRYYHPGQEGAEKQIADRLEGWWGFGGAGAVE